jgi:uncharacterized membrane protein
MAETPSATERYLERLAEGLEALGPEEIADVIAEVRAHLAEAVADAGGDEAAVLARFGSSDALTGRILEERGVLSADSGVPEAPVLSRLLALAADAALWLATLAIMSVFLAVPIASYDHAGEPDLPIVMLAWAALAAVVLGSAWWWVARWREPGHATMGMRLLGLRRIRLGSATRVVHQRDVPGSPRLRRLWPLIVTALAVLLLVPIVTSPAFDARSQTQAKIREALGDSATAQNLVTELYRSVSGGAALDELDGMYAPSARAALADLVERRTVGLVASYNVGEVDFGDWDTRLAMWPEPAQTIVVLVTVWEHGKDPASEPALYRWRVVCEMKPAGGSTYSGEWLIWSAGPTTQ